ncbi:ABC transporter ATP-binding protein, partial [Streptomyces rochei]
SLEEAFMQLTAESVEYHAHDGQPAGPVPPGQQQQQQQQWGSEWRKG